MMNSVWTIKKPKLRGEPMTVKATKAPAHELTEEHHKARETRRRIEDIREASRLEDEWAEVWE